MYYLWPPVVYLHGLYPALFYGVVLKKVWLQMFKDLDPILHSQLRLAAMSILISVKEAEFTFIKEQTNATAGNLSVQLNKLKDAGYIDITKQFKNNYPLTVCKITDRGIFAFEEYVKALRSYMPENNK